MNLQRIGAIRRHLTAKLTIPFVVVLVGTIALLGVVSIRSSRSAMEQSLAKRATWKFIGLGALALVAGAGIYLGIARRLVGPLRAAAELGELASGNADLTRRLAVSSHDEVGRLSHALNGFLDNLHGLVQEIRGAASQVGAASEQLSAASRQVASGAQEQASSLEETAASLDELTGTVRQNADNARQE